MIKNLLVTGYRAQELGIFNQKHAGIPFIKQAIMNRLMPLIDQGLEWVITGGQYGVDLWACEVALALKQEFPQLKCAIITAFSNQESKWSEEKQLYYEGITTKVDFVTSVSKEEYSGSWQFSARDDLLLRKTDGILLLYDEENGAASPKYIKERARKKSMVDGYQLFIITPEEIQDIANESSFEY